MSKISNLRELHSDELLLKGIAEGNSKDLAQVYKLYYPSIAYMIISNHGSEDEAKDIFQDALLVLYDKVSNGTFELSSKLSTYLFAVCRRMWLKKLTKGSSEFANSDLSTYEETLFSEDDLEEQEELEVKFSQMESAMAQLGEPCKTILEDFYIRNMSMTQISDKFGYTNPDNAKTQKYKCLQRLKKLFFTSK